jgi:hypothetical protein
VVDYIQVANNEQLTTVTAELQEADLEPIVAGKEGSFGRKVLGAMWSSSGFNPKNNEPWRTSFEPAPIPPTPTPPP